MGKMVPIILETPTLMVELPQELLLLSNPLKIQIIQALVVETLEVILEEVPLKVQLANLSQQLPFYLP